VPLLLHMADGPTRIKWPARQATRREPRQGTATDIFWVFSLTNEIDELVRELYRSQQMVGKYDQLRAQGKLTPRKGPA
jgi:hypothetical protein